jgi:hypothetical protein
MTAAASLSDFAARAAQDRAALFGEPILLATVPVHAVLSAPMPGLQLQSGGYEDTAGQLRVRVPVASLPAGLVTLGLLVTVIATQKRYLVKNILPRQVSPQAAEEIFDCIPA